MAEAENHEIVIIRRRGGGELDAVKGGVWKIAFADFMTAMMAFFLVMWLINAANEETKQAVASYFNPVKLANINTKGLNDPKIVEPGPTSEEKAKPSPAPDQLHKPDPEATPDTRQREEALFRDPYAVLAEIAGGADESQSAGGAAEGGLGEAVGMNGGKAFRDPFDPAFWQEANGAAAEPAEPTDAAAETVKAVAEADGSTVGTVGDATPSVTPASFRTEADAGEESTVVPAPTGGDTEGADAAGGDVAPSKAVAAAEPAPTAAEPPQEESEAPKSELEQELTKALAGNEEAGKAPHIAIERSGEGVLISLTDDVAFGMFSIGSAEPRPEVIKIMAKIAEVLKSRPGGIVIRGHTDARPFRSETYDNWRLSSARAQMAYYMLVRGGLDEQRVERIEGHAERQLKNASDPEAAENRRIEILVREVQS
jgi:chemotaxis protein MotB